MTEPDDIRAAVFLRGMTPAEYHRGSRPARLSQSIAKELCDRSPWHAKRALDRQTPQHEDDDGDEEPEERDEADSKKQAAMDRGTIIHALLLGTPSPAVIVADPVTREPFKDF